jgi:hypothetical protein
MMKDYFEICKSLKATQAYCEGLSDDDLEAFIERTYRLYTFEQQRWLTLLDVYYQRKTSKDEDVYCDKSEGEKE